MGLADQGVVHFIQNALQKGSSRSEIEQVLGQKGWKPEQIQDAFSEATRPAQSSSPVSSPASSSGSGMRTVLIILGAVFLLAILGVAYVFLVPSAECSSNDDCGSGEVCEDDTCVEDEGCSSDDDCSRGEECNTRSGECEIAEEEEEEYVAPVIKDEEPECVDDSDCDDGFGCSSSGSCYSVCTSTSGCADGYSCSSGVCKEESVSSSVVSSGKENYKILDVLGSYSKYSASFDVNYTNVGDTSSSGYLNISCIFSYENSTVINSTLVKSSTLSVNKTDIEDCDFQVLSIYETLNDTKYVNVTYNMTVDSSALISEKNETDNSYFRAFNLSLQNLSVLSNTTCTSSSSCSGYDCSILGLCYSSCTDYNDECSSGYSCSSGSCVSSSASVTGTCISDSDCSSGYSCSSGSCVSVDSSVHILGSSCTSDDECGGYVCHQKVCTECLSGDLDACVGYGCNVEDSTSESFHTCYESCSDDASCADGYSCSSGSCVEILGSSCTSDDACGVYQCHQSVCVECLSTELGACSAGYGCNVEDKSLDSFHTCYDSCSDDTSCADGYSCSSGSCVSDSASTTGEECGDVLPSCADGVDNDGDGLVDIADDACESWDDEEGGIDTGLNEQVIDLEDEVAVPLACVSESDDGLAPEQAGKVVSENDLAWKDDTLDTSYYYLWEYVCLDDTVQAVLYACDSTKDGVFFDSCVSEDDGEYDFAEAYDQDDDDGDPYTLGSLKLDLSLESLDNSLDDVCYDGTYLLEYSTLRTSDDLLTGDAVAVATDLQISSPVPVLQVYSCSYGCEDGACLEDESESSSLLDSPSLNSDSLVSSSSDSCTENYDCVSEKCEEGACVAWNSDDWKDYYTDTDGQDEEKTASMYLKLEDFEDSLVYNRDLEQESYFSLVKDENIGYTSSTVDSAYAHFGTEGYYYFSFGGESDQKVVFADDDAPHLSDWIVVRADVKIRDGSLDDHMIILSKEGEFCKTPDYALAVTSEGKYRFKISIDGETYNLDSSKDVTDDWTQLVGVYTGEEIYFFVDGELVDSVSVSGSIERSDGDLFFGRSTVCIDLEKGVYGYLFNGYVDDIYIWGGDDASDHISTELDEDDAKSIAESAGSYSKGASLFAPEQESFWVKLWNFFFHSQAAEDRFLDRSYTRK